MLWKETILLCCVGPRRYERLAQRLSRGKESFNQIGSEGHMIKKKSGEQYESRLGGLQKCIHFRNYSTNSGSHITNRAAPMLRPAGHHAQNRDWRGV